MEETGITVSDVALRRAAEEGMDEFLKVFTAGNHSATVMLFMLVWNTSLTI